MSSLTKLDQSIGADQRYLQSYKLVGSRVIRLKFAQDRSRLAIPKVNALILAECPELNILVLINIR